MSDSSAGPIEYFSSPWRFSDCAANECQKFLFRERLQQVTIRAIAHYFFSDLRIVYCSNVSEWNARIMLLTCRRSVKPSNCRWPPRSGEKWNERLWYAAQ